MSASVQILLVDDHTIFRESLVRLLAGEPGLQIVGHCASTAEAQEMLSHSQVDVILLDYDLGDEAGTSLLKYLHETGNHARVLMLTAGMTASATFNALDAGAAGVILKHSGTRQLLDAIAMVSRGEVWWDTGLLRSTRSRENDRSDRKKAHEITPRQQTVLRCILDGLTNKEIAARLKASETAVKASIQELFGKAGVRTRSQLVRVAIENFSSEWLQDKH
jgi:DNA-binding NarL/FixJ family response regulator